MPSDLRAMHLAADFLVKMLRKVENTRNFSVKTFDCERPFTTRLRTLPRRRRRADRLDWPE